MCGPPATVNGQEAESLALATRRGVSWAGHMVVGGVRDEPFRLPVHSSLRTSSIVRRPPVGAVQLKWLGSHCRDLLTVTCLYGG